MKRIAALVFVSLGIFSAVNVFAQDPKYGDNPVECKKYISFYTDYYKQNDYDRALPNWRQAYSFCPATASSNLFLHGQNLLRHELDSKKLSDIEREGIIDTLMLLFDQRSAAYPKTRLAQMNRKGLDASKYLVSEPEKMAIYKQVIDINGSDTDPQIVFFYMLGTLDSYKDGKADPERVITTYDSMMALLEEAGKNTDAAKAALVPGSKDYDKNLKSAVKDSTAISNTKNDVENLFIASRVASCENLVELFTPRYEADPDNIELIEKIVGMLNNADDCNKNDLYFATATKLYQMKPSYTAAYSLFRLNAGRDNVNEAIKYIEEAIAFEESDVEKDARMYYDLARYCSANNRDSKAIAAANSVIRLESDMETKNYTGKAYQLIGRTWAGFHCGGNEIERVAKYWIAVDYLQRARSFDPEIADECGRAIAAYSAQFPLAVDAANYDIINGQSYTVSCGGMSASTTVRTRL
ncbi:MAG: hypothetical protein IKR96_04730 [Bacteroidales bacterium]|nr:hypothetical protein [Bacteroidales bacterium]